MLTSIPAGTEPAPSIPRVPRGIAAGGRRLWRSVLADFELDSQGVELLTQACRTVDQIDALDAITAGQGVMSESSQGPRVHPAIVEARQQRATLRQLIGALGLDFDEPEDPATVRLSRSAAARSAARARWSA